jgi:hypothetical protein
VPSMAGMKGAALLPRLIGELDSIKARTGGLLGVIVTAFPLKHCLPDVGRDSHLRTGGILWLQLNGLTLTWGMPAP